MKNKINRRFTALVGIIVMLAIVALPAVAKAVPVAKTVTTFYGISPAAGSNAIFGFQLDNINNGIINITQNIPLTLNGSAPNIFTNSLSFSPTGELYAWSSRSTVPDYLTGPFTGQLYEIDMPTGAINLIGNGGEPYWMNGLAFDASGTLYGLETNLYRIDTATGARTKVSNNPIGAGHRGLAYDYVHDELYAWTGLSTIADQVLKIDRNTGATTVVPIDFNTQLDGVGTEFDPVKGNLITVKGGQYVYSADITTGHVTYLGQLCLNGNFDVHIQSLAVRQETVPVPEPVTVLLLGSGLIGLVASGRKIGKDN